MNEIQVLEEVDLDLVVDELETVLILVVPLRAHARPNRVRALREALQIGQVRAMRLQENQEPLQGDLTRPAPVDTCAFAPRNASTKSPTETNARTVL